MTLGSQTVCGGAFKDLYARVWRMDPDYRPTAVLDWTAHANDAYPPIQGRVRPDEVLFQFTAGGLLSGEVHTAVRHFTIDQGSASQVDPIAGLPRDFVVEWLSAPWEESRARSGAASLEPRTPSCIERMASGISRARPSGAPPAPIHGRWKHTCTKRPTRVLSSPLADPYSFTLVDISDTPYPDCTVADSRGEVYTDVLDTLR